MWTLTGIYLIFHQLVRKGSLGVFPSFPMHNKTGSVHNSLGMPKRENCCVGAE